jgi:FG-GAP repeat
VLGTNRLTRSLLALVTAGAIASVTAAAGSAQPARLGSTVAPTTVILEDDHGAVCVIYVTHNPHSVSCRNPGSRGYEIVGIPPAPHPPEQVSVANVGDVNGDGIDDYAIGVPWAEFDGRAAAGVTYVVFGSATPHEVDLRDLGTQGFRIGGAAAHSETSMIDQTSTGGARGDVNGDGLDDVLVQSEHTSTLGRKENGAAWVVYGKADDADVDLATLGSAEMAIDGVSHDDALPNVSIAGDLNGDGKADLAVAENPPEVVLGSSSNGEVDLGHLGARGYEIFGLKPVNGTEPTLAGVGDLNGDGIDDLFVGKFDDHPSAAFVVYGSKDSKAINVHHLGAAGFTIDSRLPTSTLNFGLSAAGLGRVKAGSRPRLVVEDPKSLYVFGAPPHGRLVDLKRTDFGGYRIAAGSLGRTPFDFPRIVVGLGDPDTDAAGGDLLVWWPVVHPDRYRDFVVFGQTSNRNVDLGRLAGRGFEITHTGL